MPNICPFIHVKLALFNSRCYGTNSPFPSASGVELTSIQRDLISNKYCSNPCVRLWGLFFKSIFAVTGVTSYERTKSQGYGLPMASSSPCESSDLKNWPMVRHE